MLNKHVGLEALLLDERLIDKPSVEISAPRRAIHSSGTLTLPEESMFAKLKVKARTTPRYSKEAQNAYGPARSRGEKGETAETSKEKPVEDPIKAWGNSTP